MIYECSAFSATVTLYRSWSNNKHRDKKQNTRLMTHTVVIQTILQQKNKKAPTRQLGKSQSKTIVQGPDRRGKQ